MATGRCGGKSVRCQGPIQNQNCPSAITLCHKVGADILFISQMLNFLHILPAADFDWGLIGMANNSCTNNGPTASDSAIRHEKLWFNDGSIVLSVQQTLFRVHRSVLCLHSEIFANMFRIPHRKDETTIEGCTVVRLPDKAADFVDFLSAFYDPL